MTQIGKQGIQSHQIEWCIGDSNLVTDRMLDRLIQKGQDYELSWLLMTRLQIVSGGDSKYFELLDELACSIKALSLDTEINLTFLDGGLKEEQKVFWKILTSARSWLVQ